MKTAFVIILFAFFNFLTAQPDAIQRLVDEFNSEAEIELKGNFLNSLFKPKESNGSDRHLSSLHVYTTPADQQLSITGISTELENEGFEILTSFRKGKEGGNILIRETPRGITDIVLLVKGEEGKLTSISVGGLFSLDDLKDVNIDVDGWQHFRS